MGISSCFRTPLKTLCLACTAAIMTTGHFFFSLYCLPICNNILYCFLNHKQHCGRKKPLALLFMSVWQMKMCGGRERTGSIFFCFLFSFSLWCCYFKAHLALFVCLFCFHFNLWMNFYKIYSVLGKMKLFLFLKICTDVHNLSKKNVLFLHRFRLLIKTFDIFLLDSFFFWKHFLFPPKIWWKQNLSQVSHILFIPKKYISCYVFAFFSFGLNCLIILEPGIYNCIFLLVKMSKMLQKKLE